jgi:hypothetical protein
MEKELRDQSDADAARRLEETSFCQPAPAVTPQQQTAQQDMAVIAQGIEQIARDQRIELSVDRSTLVDLCRRFSTTLTNVSTTEVMNAALFAMSVRSADALEVQDLREALLALGNPEARAILREIEALSPPLGGQDRIDHAANAEELTEADRKVCS